MMRIIADVDYVQGHLESGHYELNLNDVEYEKFKKMTDEEKKEFISDNGDIVIDSYEIDDIGDIEDIKIKN